MTKPTTLYRLYSHDELLYIGIAGNPGRRFEQHAEAKAWWSDVTRTSLEHFPTRELASRAESHAIKTERPRHNIMHNAIGQPQVIVTERPRNAHLLPVEFTSTYGTRHTEPLSLLYEVNGTSMSDDWLPDEITAHELFDRWQRRYVDADGWVDVWWFVVGPRTIELAPFQDPARGGGEDFLTHFTWPTTPSGYGINFNQLPVLDGTWWDEGTKGGFFQEHTGYKPAPFTERLHVPTILRAAGYSS